MEYCMVHDGIIKNIIICDNVKISAKLGAVPSYPGAVIGDIYDSGKVQKPDKPEDFYTAEDMIRALTGA